MAECGTFIFITFCWRMLVNGYVLAKCKVSDHKWINQIDRMFKGTYCVISMNSLPIFSFSKRVCFCLFLVSLFSPSDASPKVIQRHIEIPSSGFLGNMRICPGRFRRNSIVCWLRIGAAMPKLTTWIKPRQNDGSWVISESYPARRPSNSFHMGVS